MFAGLTSRLRTRFPSIVALALFAAVALSLFPVQAAAAAERGRVTAVDLNVRSGPGTYFGVLDVIHQGTAVTIHDRNAAGDWLRVSYNLNADWGWVSAQHIQRTSSTSVTLEVVNYSSETVYYLYVSPSASTSWGVDRLGTSGIILPGDSFFVTVPPGEYDFKAVNAAGEIMATDYLVPLFQNDVWYVLDQGQ